MLHFALFLFACADAHRRRRRRAEEHMAGRVDGPGGQVRVYWQERARVDGGVPAMAARYG